MSSTTVDLQFDCVGVNIESCGTRDEIRVTADTATISDVSDIILSELEACDVIEMFDNNDALLNEIGIEACKKYFDLEEIE